MYFAVSAGEPARPGDCGSLVRHVHAVPANQAAAAKSGVIQRTEFQNSPADCVEALFPDDMKPTAGDASKSSARPIVMFRRRGVHATRDRHSSHQSATAIHAHTS